MSYTLGITDEALQDLDEVTKYYHTYAPGLGLPKLFAARFRGVRKGFRGQFAYIVYYRLIGQEIEVFAVLHAKRSASAWTSRLPKP